MAEQVVVPITTSIAAGTEIDISSQVPAPIHKILKAFLHMSGTTTANSASSALTVVTTAPGAGEIQLTKPKAIKLGDAVNTTHIVVLDVQLKTDYPVP